MWTILAATSLLFMAASGSHESELRNSLMKNYDKNALPKVKSNLSVGFTILGIDMDEERQILKLETWVKMKWEDPRLSWDALSYPKIDRLAFPRSMVWTPDFTLYNNAELHTFDHLGDSMVLAFPNGEMLHVPPANIPATCILDMTYWPHDVHNCTAKFGSWVYSGNTLNLTYYTRNDDKNIVTFDIPERSDDGRVMARGSWKVLDHDIGLNTKYYACCSEPYMDIKISFIVERNGQAYNWMVKVPALCLAFVTGLLFLLPPGSAEKAVVGVIIMVLDMQFISYCVDVVKHSPSHSPLMVQFVSEQLVITLVCVFVSVVTMKLSRDPKSDSPPAWLRKFAETLGACLCIGGYKSLVQKAHQKSYGKHGSATGDQIELGDDQAMVVDKCGGTGSTDEEQQCEWLLLGALLDRFLFFIYLAVFLIKVISYSSVL